MFTTRITPTTVLLNLFFNRSSMKMSDKQIADFLGLGEKGVGMIRRGEIWPPVELLLPLARLLGIEPFFLFSFWARDYAKPLFDFLSETYGEYLTDHELAVLEELDRMGESGGVDALWAMQAKIEPMLEAREKMRF